MNVDISRLSSESFGGNGGHPFSMEGVTSVGLRAGQWIDAIIINGIQHGGDGGSPSDVIEIDYDNYDYISRIIIQTGERDGSNVITYLKIITNQGESIEGGISDGESHPIPGKIIALGGRSGRYLDKLEVFGDI